jgi:hypothetical protein
MASFVVAFNFSPQDYYNMTLAERSAIVEHYARVNRKR